MSGALGPNCFLSLVTIRNMAGPWVSQKTIVEVMRVLREYGSTRGPDFTEICYGNNLPDWFVIHAESHYEWDWKHILIDLRNTAFFFPSASVLGDSILGEFVSPHDVRVFGEAVIQKLAALATVLGGESVLRSLQLDGFDVDKEKLILVPLEGPVSAREEGDRLTVLIKASGLPASSTVLKHIEDSQSLYTDGKYHPALNESRNFIQALVDGISTETDKHGKHSTGLPAGTANRIEYLMEVNFFTPDEKAAFNSAWGSLSAGSHPGVPDREQTRIGLVLALEFGQLMLLKFANWASNTYRGFS
jgi:hypothetical protein